MREVTGTVNLPWDPGVNLGAYVDVEAETNYAGPEELQRYRELLLRKSEPVAECIRSRVYSGSGLNVLELCAGSSRLLYALHARGLLNRGLGVEVSPSRHRFAQKWKADIGADRVSNIQSAANEYRFPDETLDLVILIDGALSYLYPCDPALPERIIQQAHRRLTSGGAVLLEFDVLSQEKVDAMRILGDTRIWYSGDEKDAFRYALYKSEPISWDHMVVQNTSIYLPRNVASEKVKRELYKYYQVPELDRLFAANGFRAEYFGSFSLEPFTQTSKSLVVLARRV